MQFPPRHEEYSSNFFSRYLKYISVCILFNVRVTSRQFNISFFLKTSDMQKTIEGKCAKAGHCIVNKFSIQKSNR